MNIQRVNITPANMTSKEFLDHLSTIFPKSETVPTTSSIFDSSKPTFSYSTTTYTNNGDYRVVTNKLFSRYVINSKQIQDRRIPWNISLWYVLNFLFDIRIPFDCSVCEKIIAPLKTLIPCPTCSSHISDNYTKLCAMFAKQHTLQDSDYSTIINSTRVTMGDYVKKLHDLVNEYTKVPFYSQEQWLNDYKSSVYDNRSWFELHLNNFLTIINNFSAITTKYKGTEEGIKIKDTLDQWIIDVNETSKLKPVQQSQNYKFLSI